MNKKRGQIWVETVIYTLIGLAIIAVLLALVRPVIEEKDESRTVRERVMEKAEELEEREIEGKDFIFCPFCGEKLKMPVATCPFCQTVITS